MNDRRFRTAGWLVFVKMATGLLMLGFLLVLEAAKSRTVGPVAFRGFVLISVSVLNVYILLTLRRLLWDRYDFHQMDVIIPVVAAGEVILEILNQATELVQTLDPGQTAGIVAARVLLVVIPYGILNLVFAAGLLKLTFAEKSLLRPLAYLDLGAGVVLIAMILVFLSPVFGLFLFPLLVLIGIAADIVLGLTFLRSRETEQTEFV